MYPATFFEQIALHGDVYYNVALMNEHCCPEDSHHEGHSGEARGAGRWLANKTLIVSAVLLFLALLSYPFPFLEPFRKLFLMYVHEIGWAVFLGLVLGGLIDRYVPETYVSHLFACKGRGAVFNAVITGFFMSVCSHGILALAIQLHKKGASTPAIVAFLLASPWANLPLTLMLIGFFGWVRALYIILGAVIIALTTGLVFQILEAKGWIEKNPKSLELDPKFSIGSDIRKRIKNVSFSASGLREDIKGIWRGTVSLSNMVLWWILIGIGLASLAGAYVPEHFFHAYMGPTLPGMLATLAVATILEVCSEGTAPLAFEIFRQTGAIGNSFVFLMAGVATDYTEIGLLWHNVGRKTALWLPVVAVPQILILGVIANLLF